MSLVPRARPSRSAPRIPFQKSRSPARPLHPPSTTNARFHLLLVTPRVRGTACLLPHRKSSSSLSTFSRRSTAIWQPRSSTSRRASERRESTSKNGRRSEMLDRCSCRRGGNAREGRPRSRIAISGLVSDHPAFRRGAIDLRTYGHNLLVMIHSNGLATMI